MISASPAWLRSSADAGCRLAGAETQAISSLARRAIVDGHLDHGLAFAQCHGRNFTLPIERSAVEELLEVIIALVLDHTVPRPDADDRWSKLLGMCELCRQPASTLEGTDPEAARLIRKAIALIRTDIFETRSDVVNCLNAASEGLADSRPSEPGYDEFLGKAIRCHIEATEYEKAIRLLIRGINNACDSELHERTLANLFRIGSQIEASHLMKSSELKTLAIQTAMRAGLRAIHSHELDWDRDAQDAMARISAALWSQ